MTEEQKQALIAACADRVKAMKNYCACEPQDKEAALDLTLVEVALAALTAQPVKQPQTHDAHGFPEPAHILNSRWIEAIRAAGHEVQE